MIEYLREEQNRIRPSLRNLAVLFLLASPYPRMSAQTAPQIITTLLGPAVPGRDQAICASSLALDKTGNLYIGDCARVSKWDMRAGRLTTVAGTGVPGFAGDSGPATSAQMGSNVISLAFDNGRNLYIADIDNHVIRKVTASTGIITTVAGSRPQTPPERGDIRDGGPATAAYLSQPTGLAVDTAGNLYIAESATQLIRRVAAGTGIITSFAKIVAGQADRTSIALDEGGNLYYEAGNYIRKLPAGSAFFKARAGNSSVQDYNTGETIAGTGLPGYAGDGGPANRAKFGQPVSLAMDSAGNLYTADQLNNRVRMIAARTAIITTIAGNGSPARPKTDGAAPPWHDGDGGPAANATLTPRCVVSDALGNLYICGNDKTIMKVAPASVSIGTATPPTAKAPAATAAIPPVLYECDVFKDGRTCGIWNWKGDHYEGRWKNGAVAQMTVRRFDVSGVQIERAYPGPDDSRMTGTYRGTWESDHIAQGTFASADINLGTIPWIASISPIPEPAIPRPAREVQPPTTVSQVVPPPHESGPPAESVSPKLPPMIHECDEIMKVATCSMWTLNAKGYYDVRRPDGSTGMIVTQSLDPLASFVLLPNDAAGTWKGLRASYGGVIAYDCGAVSPCDSGHIIEGKVGWAVQAQSGTSEWRASFGQAPPAESGGFGVSGEIFEPSGGADAPVTAPSLISSTIPESTKEADAADLSGAVFLTAVIDTEGHPHDLTVVRGLGMGLDEKALESVLQWRFRPGMKDGHPVNVRIELSEAFGIFDVGAGVSAPSLISRVSPQYTPKARAASLTGTVSFSGVIDTEGHPRDLTILKGLGMGLDERAKEAVLQWRFKPGTKNRRPVNVRSNFDVIFKL